MNSANIIVLFGGIGLIIFIIWFFFGEKEKAVATLSSSKVKNQEITVIVEPGYQPARISVKRNIPVTIIFDRRDKGECTEWVIFPKMKVLSQNGNIEDKEIKTHLPEGQKTKINFTPVEAGIYEFVCGMGMVHGKLEVI